MSRKKYENCKKKILIHKYKNVLFKKNMLIQKCDKKTLELF